MSTPEGKAQLGVLSALNPFSVVSNIAKAV